MRVTIFTYNREEMIINLLHSARHEPHSVLILDDGSGYDANKFYHFNRVDWVVKEFEHTGKKGFWEKWQYAIKECEQSICDWFVFLPDDVTDVNWQAIENLTKQGWDNMPVAINLLNCGERYRWGKWSSGQEDIEVEGVKLVECGYVDGCFLTNRHTLEQINIRPVPPGWFDRPDKSSGVGFQMSKTLRAIKCKMMLPDKSYMYHGDHASEMHPDHRKKTPLISK